VPPSRSSRSRRRARRGAGASVAGFTLGLLATVTGFVFAGTGAEPAPTVEARAAAEEVVAVRLAVGAPLLPPMPRVEPAPEYQPLLADADQVIVPRHATRVRVASVGIDAEVRPVGLRYRDGELQYDTPRVEAGQYVGSAPPGEAGNTVIGGHVASRGGPAVFSALPDVAIGDTVEVFRGDQRFAYRVTEIRIVEAQATHVMGQTDAAQLTLITCLPGDNYSQRVVVVGTLL
jgi:LPXTG-site transpeptidase (sortase) family protein